MDSTNEENNKKKVNRKYIPDDISISILSKLPIKSLKRFSCVSKSWSLFLQNPNFISIFRNYFLSNSDPLDDDDVYLVFDWDAEQHEMMSFLSGERLQNVEYLAPPTVYDYYRFLFHSLGTAINGIVCIYINGVHEKAVLWNPTTTETYVVPSGLAELRQDGANCYIFHGFGYDPVADDYKIIQHVHFSLFGYPFSIEHKDNTFWEIYSLRTNSWTQLDFLMPTRHLRSVGTELYLNGMCHWWGKTPYEAYVVSFNLSNYEFFITPLDMHANFRFNLVVLNGSLAMISNVKNTTFYVISILGEIGVKESWIRLFEVDVMSCVNRPLTIGYKGNLFFLKKDGKAACFDLTTGVFEDIDSHRGGLIGQIIVYKKNLRPIGGINND
ncbi:putative F-box protein At3g16210 [Cicer arietinum]|uniref:putative F-box protein At3g16210 n=1 Tax=Cicer arietinum TaxID=3827 RepID=UPI00032A6D6A